MQTEELLARIDERTGHILEHLKAVDTRCQTHDVRLEKLESWRNRIIGAFGVIVAILSIFGFKIYIT